MSTNLQPPESILPDGAPDDAALDDAAPDDGRPGSGRLRRTASAVADGAALLIVVLALVAPNEMSRFVPAAFLRIPVEGLLGVAVVLVLPRRWRRWAAVPAGVALGALVIVKLLDVGFHAVLARPFNPELDLILLDAAVEFLTSSIGRAGAIAAVVGVGLVALAVLTVMTLSALRVARLAARHDTKATGAVAALGAAWVVCALVGAQLVPGVPVAGTAYDRPAQPRTGPEDRRAFAAQAAVDAFRDTPGDRLLTALRGKDVVVAFVESYGRDAVEDPEFAPHVGAVLDAGNRRLRAAGFAARSGFLTSPTVGGGSWLAHATLLSGLWVDNQQRYDDLVTGGRLTLNGAFNRAEWRTVGVMPGVTRDWPEASFFGYDKVYTRWTMGYRGPGFNWGTIPDQYTLAAFERLERAREDGPVMAEIPLVSSHAPWAPLPRLVGWKDVGDGSAFGSMAAAGHHPDDVWGDLGRVRTEYRRSIEYSLSSLISYVETYGDDDLVLVVLGDHQPAPLLTGAGASRDVPISVVAMDPAVLDRISSWNWDEGLKPGAKAPVWPMHSFRDRFLTAYSPEVSH